MTNTSLVWWGGGGRGGGVQTQHELPPPLAGPPLPWSGPNSLQNQAVPGLSSKFKAELVRQNSAAIVTDGS